MTLVAIRAVIMLLALAALCGGLSTAWPPEEARTVRQLIIESRRQVFGVITIWFSLLILVLTILL